MNSPDIFVKDLVLLGGGHAHLHTLKMLGMNPIPGVSVTLITKDIESPYSGMIPGFVAGHYTREECHVDVSKITSFGGVNLILAEVCKLDTDNKLIYCKDGRPPIHYDILSIDVGIAPRPLPVTHKDCKSNITPVKPIDGFAMRWEVILDRVIAVDNGTVVRVAIVGGGAGGVELCFAMHHRLHREMLAIGKDPSQLEITIYNRGKTLMSQHNSAVRNIISRIALERGIHIELSVELNSVEVDGDKNYLVSTDNKRFLYDEAIWCTEAMAQSWVKESELETSDDGFICVTTNLESRNTPGVFACGDVANLVDNPRPKAGVFAVRAGPPLTLNLRNKLLNIPLIPWIPQEQFLGLISTGNEYAIASKGPYGIEGEFLWKLKDKIDRQWMSLYQDLPDKEEMMKAMGKKIKLQKQQEQIEKLEKLLKSRAEGKVDDDDEEEEEDDVSAVARTMGQDTIDMLSHAKMRCGGCGSKVGASVLSRALSKVKYLLHSRTEVIAGIGGKSGDDAALILPPLPPSFLVQTIDYFRSFVSDPYLFGQIAANHALSDIYAMNGEPVSALALCVLPYGPEEKVENSLVQMLAGCLFVLQREGCSLVGGHTSEGTECAMGLAVTGVGHPDKIFHKGLSARHLNNNSKAITTQIDDNTSNTNISPYDDNSTDGDSITNNSNLGQVLVLTKGLGTGTIMAAHMRAKVRKSVLVILHQTCLESTGSFFTV
jgi:selenide,water dikinase